MYIKIKEIGDVEIGKWTGEDKICLTINNLKPEFFEEADSWDFEASVKDLKEILEYFDGSI